MKSVKPLALEVDVFDHIINRIAESGESPSTFLRRCLALTSSSSSVAPPTAVGSVPPAPRYSEMDALFSSAEFRHAKGVVGRFLVLLGWLYQKHRPYFDKVETIKGRGRLYFAKSEDALNDAGKSVNPKQIPNSPFWVITTSPTDLKQQMIRSVMFTFGYPSEEIRRAEGAIAGFTNYHLEIWHVDGTILGERDGAEAFPEWRVGERVQPEMINKAVEVREILDSSNEESGSVYFRRIVRVADVPVA
jgi:negative modulator of initiation of replication